MRALGAGDLEHVKRVDQGEWLTRGDVSIGAVQVEQVVAGAVGEPIDVGPVGRERAQRGVEVLPGESEALHAWLMRDAKYDEHLGIGPFGERAVSPRVGRPTALIVDVGADDGPQSGAASWISSRRTRAARASRLREVGREPRAESLFRRGVRPSCQSR